MCTGIVLPASDLPLELIDRHQLSARLHERGGEPECRFLWRHRPALLPVWHEGQLRLVRWGCRRGESRTLPTTGWTWRESVEGGKWQHASAQPVDIPARLILERGVWISVRQGVRGLLVEDERQVPTVYVVIEPASHYYQVMTRGRWMPVLIGERI